MRSIRTIAVLTMAAAVAAIASHAGAETLRVAPSAVLQQMVDAASDGDTLLLPPGRYKGPIKVDKPLTLSGEPGAIIAGDGNGSVITVTAPGTVVTGLRIEGSGMNLDTMDSGIFIEQTATGARIENCELVGNLFGIYLHGAQDSLARKNRIVGTKDRRFSESGNGISLWNAPGAQVIDNDISFGRDGVSTNASKRNVFRGNHFSNTRFAIHYMYTNQSEISGNVSTGNVVGFAIMFSSGLKIVDNISDGDRDHGLLLNYTNKSEIERNVVRGRLQKADRWLASGAGDSDGHSVPQDDPDASVAADGVRLGPEKCVFIYNANRNRLRDNIFENCAIGIHFTAGSEGNVLSGNAFLNNRNQVKYVGSRYLDWSEDGRGNFWSDNPAFDLDGDGIADNPYRPNGIIDKVLWTSPQAKVLTSSPAVQIIRWAQARFPALLPGGVVDSRPLMAPPAHRSEVQ